MAVSEAIIGQVIMRGLDDFRDYAIARVEAKEQAKVSIQIAKMQMKTIINMCDDMTKLLEIAMKNDEISSSRLREKAFDIIDYVIKQEMDDIPANYMKLIEDLIGFSFEKKSLQNILNSPMNIALAQIVTKMNGDKIIGQSQLNLIDVM